MARSDSVSVLIPARRGGALLQQVVSRVLAQETSRRVEVLVVDSGSEERELAALSALGARVERIAPESFDHGSTRDLAASMADGAVLVFLNQDALPVGAGWLESLLAPFDRDDPPAAAQGAIREFPTEQLAALGRRRFFWESCGPRFYFTRESRRWISENQGIGFSTVHCALSRSAWRELPFGAAPILEDKQWQAAATRRGWRIEPADDAVVWHTHDYDLSGLLKRCASEGYGWRRIGVRYPLRTALGDLAERSLWREWRRGARSGEMRRVAEVVFPLARPLSLWWGNRWGSRSWS